MAEPEDYSLYALKIAERAADIFASLGEGGAVRLELRRDRGSERSSNSHRSRRVG